MSSNKWWSEGVSFRCQGSGKCCSNHGRFGYVYLTLKERRGIARILKIPTQTFTKRYCKKTDNFFHLINPANSKDCIFLKNKQCKIYQARPIQCRTWPFWPEVMRRRRAWIRDVSFFCPGAGRGKKISENKIHKQLSIQQKSEKQLHLEAKQLLKKKRKMAHR